MHFNSQYNFIKSSRHVLLDYCATISEKDFIAENSSSGKRSIRDLLVHIANTYESWIGRHALNFEMEFTEYDNVKDLFQARELFLNIDLLIANFIDVYSNMPVEDLILNINNKRVSEVH